ncbi:MAG TPA: DUF4190 domain-containing protein [Actinospica sp.]|nr:DUF4190 domain-containing protein [Actinospica sp.]
MTYGPQDPYATPQYPDPRTGPQAAQQAGPGYPDSGYQDYGDYRQAPPTPGPYPYGYPYPPRQGTNTLAILALVFAFIFAPAAIVLGTVARKQIRRTGEEGWGLATAGMIVGIVFTVLTMVWIVVAVTIFATVAHDVNQQQQDGVALLAMARAGLRV